MLLCISRKVYLLIAGSLLRARFAFPITKTISEMRTAYNLTRFRSGYSRKRQKIFNLAEINPIKENKVIKMTSRNVVCAINARYFLGSFDFFCDYRIHHIRP